MTPLEFRHEIAAIKALGEAGIERLEGLYNKVEIALDPTEVICERCRNIRETEAEFPDHLEATRLRIGAGEGVEYIPVTPLLGSILDRLVAGRGAVQSYETLIFHAYYTGVNRPMQRVDEPEHAMKIIHVMICRFRKKLSELKQKVQVETRHGQGLILLSDVKEIVLEVA